MISSTRSIFSRSVLVSRANSDENTRFLPGQRQLQVLEHAVTLEHGRTLELPAHAPRWAISSSRS